MKTDGDETCSVEDSDIEYTYTNTDESSETETENENNNSCENNLKFIVFYSKFNEQRRTLPLDKECIQSVMVECTDCDNDPKANVSNWVSIVNHLVNIQVSGRFVPKTFRTKTFCTQPKDVSYPNRGRIVPSKTFCSIFFPLEISSSSYYNNSRNKLFCTVLRK